MISDLTSLEAWAGLMSRWLHHSRMEQALGSSAGWMKWAPGPRAVYDKHLYAAVMRANVKPATATPDRKPATPYNSKMFRTGHSQQTRSRSEHTRQNSLPKQTKHVNEHSPDQIYIKA